MDTRLGELPGAILDQVAVDWRNGIVRITFLSTPKRPHACAVRALDFTSVAVPRDGASHRVKSATSEGDLLEIAMESGETLRVRAASFAFDELSG